MVIFHSYVSLPEGNPNHCHSQARSLAVVALQRAQNAGTRTPAEIQRVLAPSRGRENSWVVPHTPITGVYGDYIFIVRGMNLTNSEVSEHNSNNVWGYGYDLNYIFISGMNLTNSELSTTKGRSPRGFNHDQQMFSLKMVLFFACSHWSSTMWEANDLHNHHNIFWLCTSWEAIPIKHGDLFRSKLWNYRRVPGKRGMFSNHSGHFHTLFYTVIYIYIY